MYSSQHLKWKKFIKNQSYQS